MGIYDHLSTGGDFIYLHTPVVTYPPPPTHRGAGFITTFLPAYDVSLNTQRGGGDHLNPWTGRPIPFNGVGGWGGQGGMDHIYHMYVFIYIIYIYMCEYIYVCMYVCTYVCMYVCTYVRMHACMHACMHVCMYVCINIYIYIYCSFHPCCSLTCHPSSRS